MPKKRKTRKEKILHDQKEKTVHQVAPPVVSSPKNVAHPQAETTVTSATFSLPITKEKISAKPEKIKETPQTITIATNDYGYLSTDLMRTALLTGAIVFAELLIKILFKV
jgi:hypothetical protein